MRADDPPSIAEPFPERAYAEVAIPNRLARTLCYAVPPGLRPDAALGQRVLVPLGSHPAAGYLVGFAATVDLPATKALLDILDPQPVLDPPLLDLTRWVAEYYLSDWGRVIQTAIPPGIEATIRRLVVCDDPARLPAPAAPAEAPLLQGLARRGRISLARVPAALGAAAGAFLARLERAGAAHVHREVVPPRVKPRVEPVARLADAAPAALARAADLARRAPRQAAALRALAGAGGCLPVEALGSGPPSGPILRALLARGLVRIERREVPRDPFAREPAPRDAAPPPPLTGEQAAALADVVEALAKPRFAPILLFGVTGSGKTEVYLRATAEALAAGGQVLVLVPEIGLTPLTVARFRARFGDRVAVLHSALTPGERADQWRRIRAGELAVAIGARSAVFAPFPALRLVVVDEEHDPAYKQADAPRYHARDVAIMRARRLGIPILLGSATPSLEGYHHAGAGRYRLHRLTRRIGDRPLPVITIVDMRREAREGRPWLSRALEERLRDRLARGEQSLLFLNRRGYASLLLCEECGHALQCVRCSVGLTYHAQSGRLRCHYCDHQRRPPETCPACRGVRLRYLGLGTQQVEEAIRRLLPAARVLRMDRDTTRARGAHAGLLRQVGGDGVDILVGTQMIGKGHDFPRVTLVGAVAADLAINLPDFRAGERAVALLMQVAGRAGRGEAPGEALIQSYDPAHYCLAAVAAHDYAAFAEAELPRRRPRGLPPFTRMIQLLASSPVERQAEEAAEGLARLLRRGGLAPDQLDGPAPMPLYRLRGRYRWRVLLRGPSAARLNAKVRAALAATGRLPDGTRLEVDVDPADLT